MKKGIEAELFRQAVAASQDGLVIADARLPDMPLLYVNPAFERLTGYPGAEAVGNFAHQQGVGSAIRKLRDPCGAAQDVDIARVVRYSEPALCL